MSKGQTVEITELRQQRDALLEALKLFMNMFNSGDLGSSSKRAQQRRVEMWDKANAAVAAVEGKR